MVAQLGNEEGPLNPLLGDSGCKTVHAAIGTRDGRFPVGRNYIALDPGSEVERFPRHVVLGLARIRTTTAADTLAHINPHPVIMLFGIVGRLLGSLSRCGHTDHRH